MRQVTATEKYRAVNEGKMAKKEFVRQMRQTYPMYISQYDGFDSTVQILKNRQLLFEAPKKAFSNMKVYDDRPALTYSLDALDRGIRAELTVLGLDPAVQSIKREDLDKATNKAKDNLEKDANHYLNLMAGESNKVDKHDREKEVKRGALDKDTFNDMKKATLKEGVDYSNKDGALAFYDNEDIVGTYGVDDAIEFAKELAMTHFDAGPQQDKFVNDFLQAYKESGYDKGEEVEEIGANPEMSEDAKKNLLGKVVGALRTKYPDITAGILKDFIKTHYQDLLDGADIEDEFAEYISVNYEGPSDMGEKKGTDHDGDGDIDGDDYMAAKDKAIKKAMGKGVEEDQERDHNFYDNEEKAQKIMQIAKDAIALMDEQPGTSVKDAIEAVMEFMDESYAMKRMQKAHTQDRLAGKKSTYDQAKEKDKGKEKQLKEAIKSIIKKTLNEDVINEAATSRLSQKMEEFGGYSGAQGVINSLENIVTEVEAFYGKVREKIQKVYDDMGNIENEEGLKIGQFIGPAIESAFMQDLRPVTKKGFTQDLQLPKAKQIDPEMLAQARAAGEVDEAPEEPKSTVFTPNF